jgi:hypothetical protein
VMSNENLNVSKFCRPTIVPKDVRNFLVRQAIQDIETFFDADAWQYLVQNVHELLEAARGF